MNKNLQFAITEEMPTSCESWQQAYQEASSSPAWQDEDEYITYLDRRKWTTPIVRYSKAFLSVQAQKEVASTPETTKMPETG